MALRHTHTQVHWSALASIIIALAIGSVPVAAMLALASHIEAL